MTMFDPSWIRALQQCMRGKILFDVPMSRYTSFQIGGPADALAFPQDPSDLQVLMKTVRQVGIPYLVMGKGTNLLVQDRGVRGIVINLSAGFRAISAREERISAGSGVLLNDMIDYAMKRELSGLASLSGIPGSVGGGLAMNAGAWGSEMKERVESIVIMNGDGRSRELLRSDLVFGYRRLDLPEGAIIVAGTFLMERQRKQDIRGEITRYRRKRQETQPLSVPSAGSIFKNPTGASAGMIIEELGLKGKRVGGAEVSAIHANFIVNTGGATANDVLELIDLIRKRVREERGINLEPEVRIVGEPIGTDPARDGGAGEN